jgi:hypothetical protein
MPGGATELVVCGTKLYPLLLDKEVSYIDPKKEAVKWVKINRELVWVG